MKKEQPTQTQLTRRATAAAARESVLDSGGKALYVLLDAKYTKRLEALKKRHGISAREVVERGIDAITKL